MALQLMVVTTHTLNLIVASTYCPANTQLIRMLLFTRTAGKVFFFLLNHLWFNIPPSAPSMHLLELQPVSVICTTLKHLTETNH